MRRILLASVVLLLFGAQGVAQTPPRRPHARTVFENLSVDQALAKAEADGRLLLVDCYAREPGRDDHDPARSTILGDLLHDQALREWVRANAVLVRADWWTVWDSDVQIFGDWEADALLAVKERSEVARLEEALDADDLIAWLEVAKNELSALDRALAEANRPFEDFWDLYWAKSNVIEALSTAGRDEEALTQLLDLWDACDEAGAEALGIRSNLMYDLWDVIQDYPEGRARVEARRDALEATLKGGQSTSRDLTDWIQFNYALDDEAKIIAWVERVIDRPEAQRYLQDPILDIATIMLEQERWDLAGRTMQFPVQLASIEVMANRAMFAADMGDDDDEEFAAWQLEDTLMTIGEYYGACLAAGRDEEAAQIVEAAKELEVDPRIVQGMMVQAAHLAGAVRPFHREWVLQAQAIGVPFDDDVLAAVEEAVRAAPN